MQSMEPNWPPVMYQEVAGGILQLDYGVATVLYATALGTFDGLAEHTQGGDEDTDGGEVFIGVGSGQMLSLQENTIENSTAPQAHQTIEDHQIQSVPAHVNSAMGANPNGPQIPRGRDPIVFVPVAAVTGGSQTVTAGMVSSLNQANLFSDAQLATTAMALGFSGLSFASHAAGGGAGGGDGLPDGHNPAQATAFDWGHLNGAAGQQGQPAHGAAPVQPGAWTDAQGQDVAPGGTVWPGADPATDATAPMQVLTPALNSDPAAPAGTSGSASVSGVLLPPGFTSEEAGNLQPVLTGANGQLPLDYPTVQSDRLEGTEDEALTFSAEQLLANDSTPNPVPMGLSGGYYNGLRIVSVGEATNGQVGIQGGQLVFVPDPDFHGVATFSYTVQDMYGMQHSGMTSVFVAPVNDAPVARGESATGLEDTDLLFTAASLLRNDTDVDGDRLFISRVGEATGGTVLLQADGSVRFVPTPNYNGPAGYAYWVSDGQEQVRADVRLNILQVNDLPVVQGEYIESDEDVVLNIPFEVLLANDTDVDTDPALNRGGVQTLTISAVGNAQHGTVEIVNGQVRFTPDQDYFGPASFDYLVDDGAGGQVSATVVLSLAPVNDAPHVMGESSTIAEDTAIIYTQAELLANDSDVDNPHSDLRISQVGGAVHGDVELLPDGRIRFVPAADYFGPASFDYLVDDGVGGQSLGTVTLDVTPVNDDPRLQGERIVIDEDTVAHMTATQLLANDHDVDNDHADLSITAVGQAVNGVVTMDGDGRISFAPTANYYGEASFTYTVVDGVGGSSTATVVLDYQSVNDLPVVNDELVLGKRGISYTFDPQALLANDTDVEHPNQLQIVAVGGALNGEVTQLPNGHIRFVPAAGYEAWDPTTYGSFEYTVRDPDGGEAVGVVAIDYSRVNLNPIAVNDHFQGYEDVRMEINVSQLLRNDHDPDATPWSRLEVVEVANAQHGSVSLNNGVVSFNPQRDYYGDASFRYRVIDGEGGSTWATAYIDIERENRPPVITNVEFLGATWLNQNNATVHFGNIQGTIDEGGYTPTSYTIVDNHHVQDPHRSNGRVYAYDPDGDAVTFSISPVHQPGHGNAYINEYLPGSVPRNLTPGQLMGRDPSRPWTDYSMGDRVVMEGFNPALPNGGRRDYFVNDFSTNGNNAYAAWQYVATDVTGYRGPDSFIVTATDSRGLSTSVTVNVQSTGWSSGGGGCFPVVVDTSADGIDLLRPDESNMFADINGDGWRDQIGWVASTDALLAYDSNGDGQINRREEVSFVDYLPGARTDLEGLAAFDTNGDGVLSADDAEWSRFGLLQDANGNGVQDEGEWQSLESLGAQEISLQRQGQAELNNGNVVFGTTTVTYTDGRTQTAGDVMFAGHGVAIPDWVQAELNGNPTVSASDDATVQVAGAGPSAEAVSEQDAAVSTDASGATSTEAPDPAEEAVSDDMGTPAPSTVQPPSIEQQANAFVQMANTQPDASEPVGFVDARELAMSEDEDTIIVLTDEPRLEVSATPVSSAAALPA
jgi:predicted RNA-binding protein with TRAM domain